MENKHFSHIHNLGLHQMPQGNQISCSGCKFQGSGSGSGSGTGTGSGLFYICWDCNFFLHEQCFKASRYMQHPSHPTHPLTLAPYPTYPSNSFFCNSCNLVGTGLSYGCSLCEFDLHVHCAYMSKPHESFPNNPYQNHPIPNNMHQYTESVPSYPYPNYNPQHDHNNYHAPNYNPQHPYMPQTSIPHPNDNVPAYPESREIKKHFSHEHPLHMSRMRKNEIKLCSGCEEDIQTSAYSCMESQCDFNLHVSCFNMPREIRHNSHPKHPLTLITYSPETNGYTCDACLRKGFAFSYNCSHCHFDLHVDCANLPTAVKRQDHEHALSLLYYSPYKKPGEEKDTMGECDVCHEIAPDASWIYYCRKCDFGTHTYCVNSKAKEQPLGKSEMAHISGAQTMMEKLMESKIKHDTNNFILHYLI